MNKGLRQPAVGGVRDKVKVKGEKEVRDFRELQVWKKAVELFEDAVKDIERFPKTEAARIISNQALRSISSISANI